MTIARQPSKKALKLRCLIDEGSVAEIRALVSKNDGLIGQEEFLHQAAANGRADVCEILVRYGADPNRGSTLSLGTVPLARACRAPDLETVRKLLELGALPDGTDITPAPPLVSAATSGNLELARFLVEAGADVNREHLAQPLTPTGWADYYAEVKPTGEVAAYLRSLGGINPYNDQSRPEDFWDGVRGEMQIELVERALKGRVHPVPFEDTSSGERLTLRQSRFSAEAFLFRLLFSVDFVDAGGRCEVAVALPRFWPNHAAALHKGQFRWPWDLMFAVGRSLADGAVLQHGDVLSRESDIFRGVSWQPGFDQWLAVRHESLAERRRAVPSAGLSDTIFLVPHIGKTPLKPGKASKAAADAKAKVKWNASAGKRGRNTLIVPLCYDAPWLNGDWV